MAYGLFGLRHHCIIRCNNNNSKICYLGTTCTHRGKGLVTRRIQEGDGFTTWHFHMIGSNMLCDTSRFSGYHIGIADIVEQGCFTMVNVTHDGDNGGTGTQVLRCIFIILFLHLHLLLHVYELYFITKLTGYEFYHFSIETLVDGYHDTQTHTFADDFSKVYVE